MVNPHTAYNQLDGSNAALVAVSKSNKQVILENNGCRFKGQEALDNHEIDISKDCYCGRPNKSDKD